MIYSYPACFFKDVDGYSAFFPDFGNVATCGKDLVETTFMAMDLLALLISDTIEEKKALPTPTPVDSVNPKKTAEDLDFSYSSYLVNNIVVDLEEYTKKYFGDTVIRPVEIPKYIEYKILELDEDINLSQIMEQALKKLLKLD